MQRNHVNRLKQLQSKHSLFATRLMTESEWCRAGLSSGPRRLRLAALVLSRSSVSMVR